MENPAPTPTPTPATVNSRTEGQEAGGGTGDETVPFSEFKSVKDDMHRFKEEARANAQKLKEIEERKMQENNNWKEFASAKEKEANEYKQKYETVTRSITEGAKLTAVKEEARKLGMVDAAIDDLELMDLKGVVVETTNTGRIKVMGAKQEAERIKSIRPHWFSVAAPGVNGGTPQVLKPDSGGRASFEDIKKLEAEAHKSGDWTKYKQALMTYKK